MRWSFESTEYGIFDGGVIELNNIVNVDTRLEYVDVSNAKVTNPKQ